ncbi:unnamed protein product [Owenia fusiformis]|uniref:Uncharacterized protein n=1 Tax=Owenia fusiformis TaxID=6347 RepID=A0A8J1T812_OWEFU|nr:unnamed protein product [Owenia fusiformis]
MSLMSQDHWPVICHTSLESSDIVKLLQQEHKVRFSSNTEEDTCIFPLSGIAFMIMPLKNTITQSQPGDVKLHENFLQRMDRFIHVHQKCYFLALAAIHERDELKIFSLIQQKYFSSKLNLIPIHNARECLKVMTTIAKVTCKPMNKVLQDRLDSMLEIYTADSTTTDVIKCFNLPSHESLVLKDGLGSVRNIIKASKDELLDCSLDKDVVASIQKYIKGDSK